MSRDLFSPWDRFTTLEEKHRDCVAYIDLYGPHINAHAWESVLKHQKGPGAGRGVLVVDLSTERNKLSTGEVEIRMAFIPTVQFVDHGWIVQNSSLLNLVQASDPQKTYVCVFTDGFEYTETGQELPALLLSIDEQSKREVEKMLRKSGQLPSQDDEEQQEGHKKEKADQQTTSSGPSCATCSKKEGSDKFPVCGRCRQNKVTHPPKYCSRECQQKDWLRHKTSCGKLA